MPFNCNEGYVCNVLEDAQTFSNYAKKKTIDGDDIRLAIQLQVDKSFSGPPPRDMLLEIARNKNSQTLPAIKSHNGPRLPPDRYSLVSCNYKQKLGKNKSGGSGSHLTLPFRSTQIQGTSLLTNATQGPSTIMKTLSSVSLRPSTQTLQIQVQPRLSGSSNAAQLKTPETQPVLQGIKRPLDDN